MFKLATRVIIAAMVIMAVFAAGVFLALNGVLFGEPRTTTSVVPILERIQAMSQLTSTRYTYSLIVTSEREMPGILAALYGERLVMVAVGHVNAGIDLSQLEDDDIQQVQDTLVIRLPPPALQDCFFNESASYVVSRDTGLFARPLPDLDQRSRQLAIGAIRVQALEDNILVDANTQAATVISGFIGALPGVGSVRIETSAADPEAPIPSTCQ